MSSLRVVLYAEGAGELGGEPTLPKAPGNPLLEDDLGPGHVLLQRAIEHASSIPAAAVLFDAPLRIGRGRVAKGSDLLVRGTLRRLLTRLMKYQPDLVVVLVDEDGERGRKRKLEGWVQDKQLAHVIAVAVPEFEAWLLGDARAVAEVLDGDVGSHAPETLEPREPKRKLAELTASRHPDADRVTRRRVRLSLSSSCDLEVLSRTCPSLQTLLVDLRDVVAAVVGGP